MDTRNELTRGELGGMGRLIKCGNVGLLSEIHFKDELSNDGSFRGPFWLEGAKLVSLEN